MYLVFEELSTLESYWQERLRCSWITAMGFPSTKAGIMKPHIQRVLPTSDHFSWKNIACFEKFGWSGTYKCGRRALVRPIDQHQQPSAGKLKSAMLAFAKEPIQEHHLYSLASIGQRSSNENVIVSLLSA